MAWCQAEQARAIQVKQTNAKLTDYKLLEKVTQHFLRSTEKPWGVLASPSPCQPLQPAAANLHPTQSCRILCRDRFELDSFHCLSYFRPRPLQLWPMVKTNNKKMNEKANLVLIAVR